MTGRTGHFTPFVLGLDLDGFCADYTSGLPRFVATDRGVDPAFLPDPVDWDWTRCDWGIGSRKEYLDLHAPAVAAGRSGCSTRCPASRASRGGCRTPASGSV